MTGARRDSMGSCTIVTAGAKKFLFAMPNVSLKTVYQTVHDLEALGEVDVLDLGTGSLRVDPNVEHAHHHLVCRSCGRIRDLPVEFDALRVPARFRRDFTVDAVQVIFRGRCDDCS